MCIQLKQVHAYLARVCRFNIDPVLIYVCTPCTSPRNMQQQKSEPHKWSFFFCWHREKRLVAPFGAGDPGGTRFRKRRSHAAAFCRLNRDACAVANKRDLGLLHNRLFFILPAFLSSSPACGNTHFLFLFSPFFTPPPTAKQRLGNEWGPFPQRRPGNVKTDFQMTPLEVAGCILSLCFNLAGLTRQLGELTRMVPS